MKLLAMLDPEGSRICGCKVFIVESPTAQLKPNQVLVEVAEVGPGCLHHQNGLGEQYVSPANQLKPIAA